MTTQTITMLKSGDIVQAVGKFLLRYGLVLVVGWIGAMKFTAYEANGIQPLVANSPFMGWIYHFLSVRAFSSWLGVLEIAIAVMIALWPFSTKLSALGTKLLTIVLLTAATAFAQSSDRLPVTDAEKIADAMRAGPAFITKDATLLDWPSKPGGEYRLLRKGSNGWTCLPAIPLFGHDEPGCFDQVFLQWMQDSLAGRKPRIDRIGISYMYLGAWVKSAKGASPGHEFRVGPHLMVVSPHEEEFQGLNRDPANGMPYVTHLPNRTELFLVMPVRQWNE